MAGGEPQSWRVFSEGPQPASAPAPALLLFHGGGWSRGSLAISRRGAYFANRCFVAATADYRMHKNEDFPVLPPGDPSSASAAPMQER